MTPLDEVFTLDKHWYFSTESMMNIGMRDIAVMTLTALGFSYMVIYGIIFSPNMEVRLLFLVFILFFTFLLWLNFNPYMKILYLLLSLWSSWSASPVLALVAKHFGLVNISDILLSLGGIPNPVHVVVALLCIVTLLLHFFDRLSSRSVSNQSTEKNSEPRLIEMVVWCIEGLRQVIKNKDKLAAVLFFILTASSVVVFSALFYFQRVFNIPEISDDVLVISILATSIIVTGEASRHYRRVFHPLVRIFISTAVFCAIGGLASLSVVLIENLVLGEECHEFNAFKVLQIILCGFISWFSAQLGAQIGSHSKLTYYLSEPKASGGVWKGLLLGQFASGTVTISVLLFAAFVLGFSSEITYGATNCT